MNNSILVNSAKEILRSVGDVLNSFLSGFYRVMFLFFAIYIIAGTIDGEEFVSFIDVFNGFFNFLYYGNNFALASSFFVVLSLSNLINTGFSFLGAEVSSKSFEGTSLSNKLYKESVNEGCSHP